MSRSFDNCAIELLYYQYFPLAYISIHVAGLSSCHQVDGRRHYPALGACVRKRMDTWHVSPRMEPDALSSQAPGLEVRGY